MTTVFDLAVEIENDVLEAEHTEYGFLDPDTSAALIDRVPPETATAVADVLRDRAEQLDRAAQEIKQLAYRLSPETPEKPRHHPMCACSDCLARDRRRAIPTPEHHPAKSNGGGA
jgi:hypothetical protein